MVATWIVAPQGFDAAEKILIVGGTIALVFSFIIGLWLSRVRKANPDAAHGWLLNAHRMALQESFMFFGLTLAVAFSQQSAKVEQTAAWMFVASGVLLVASSISNHLKGVGDQFKERSLGLRFGTGQAVLALVGSTIVLVGVLRAL